MKVVLLAAGLGKRLLPITESTPKPMITIAGKPLLEYVIDDLVNSGFDEICIVIGHLGYQIKNYFKDGTEFNSKISYVIQNNYTGTASAIKLAQKFVDHEPFLLYLADTIILTNLEFHLQKMITTDSEITVLSAKTKESELTKVGNIEIKNNSVLKITEKSSYSKSDLGWAGIAFFKTNYIFDMIEQLNPSFRGEYEITEAMNLALNENKTIRNQICEKYIDAGTICGILELNHFILSHKDISLPNISNMYNIQLNNPVYVGKNSKIGNNVKLGPFTSIGDNVCIGDNVTLEQSVILNDTIITSNQNIFQSLLSPKGKLLATP